MSEFIKVQTESTEEERRRHRLQADILKSAVVKGIDDPYVLGFISTTVADHAEEIIASNQQQAKELYQRSAKKEKNAFTKTLINHHRTMQQLFLKNLIERKDEYEAQKDQIYDAIHTLFPLPGIQMVLYIKK